MLTPVDIENKIFKKVKIGGYDINEVEDFLEEIIVDYESLYKENFDLKDKLEKSEETENYYNTLERGVSKTIENSQKAAEDIKDKAESDAEKIKSDAEFEASRIVDDAKIEAERIKSDAKSNADKLLDDAKIEASKIIDDAKNSADRIETDTKKEAEDSSKKINTSVEEIKLEIRAKELELEKIKKEMQIYKIKVRSMVEAQLEILNGDEE